ncbi:protease inhibitor I42 family protein [Sphingomonas sp. 4RDLI-65]|uniref:hypothetical protein n=1 Tax=Sphingomonas sp. 4RDLI-65 TaxID=3111641 RepID=UPI003C1839D4
MNWVPGIAAMALAASGLAAGQPAAGTTGVLRVKDVGRLVSVKPGSEIRIALPSVIGTSYRWRILTAKRVTLAAPITMIDDPDRSVGAPGLPQVALIRLRAPSSGTASVLLGEVRDGSGGGAESNSYRFRFRVTP